MNLLLDTHAFVWFVEGNRRLSPAARSVIEDEQNNLWLSLASVWEMAIKSGIGKLTLHQPLKVLVDEQAERNVIGFLDIGRGDVLAVASLPLHHRDPFDRLLAATAAERG